MFLRKVVGRYEEGANYKLGQSLSGTAVASIFGRGGKNINVLEEYSGYAWKAIDIKAAGLSAQDVFVERSVGDKWQADNAHEFNQVLDMGASGLELSDILEAHSKSMDLYGESFWYYSKGESQNKPMGIYLLDPNKVTVYIADNKVSGYMYDNEGMHIGLDVDEVDHYKIQDWRHPFRGTGAMQSAGWFVRSVRYTQTWVNNFFENNAIPSGVVVAKGQVNDDDWQLFKEQWQAKYGGIDNAGKTGYIRGSDLDFVKTGIDLGEFDVDKVKNSSRDDILMMFGVSKPMAAIFEDINRASSLTARQLFGEQIVDPALKKIKRKLTKRVNEWYGSQFRIGTTNPIPEDPEAKLQIYDKGVGRWLTVNEAREAYGHEPLTGKEYSEIQASTAAKNPTSEESKTYPQPTKKTVGKIVIKKVNKADLSYEMKESFRSKAQEVQEKYEKKFLQAMNPILTEQRDKVLDSIKPKKYIDASLDPEEEANKMKDAVESIMIELADEQGTLAAIFAGNAQSTFDLTPVMRTAILDHVRQSSLEFTEQTSEAVAEAIKLGLEDGDSLSQIAKNVEGIYKDVTGVKTPGYRIERLSRTEVIKASNQMTLAAYKQSGVVSKKEWLAQPGACEFCKALDGSIIPLDSTFLSKGLSITGVSGGTFTNSYESVEYPGLHPNDRCTIIPVIDGA